MTDASTNATAKSADKVSVACKLPAGLIIRTDDGKTIKLLGSNDPGAIAGFGITKDVNAEAFDKWAEKSQHPAVRNGSIFTNTAGKVAGEAKEKADDVKSGLEPLDGAKPMAGIERVPDMRG